MQNKNNTSGLIIKDNSQHSLIVQCQKNILSTTSLVIAERFQKNHKNVLNKIDQLIAEDDFNQLDFKPVKYKDTKGEMRRMFVINRRSFSILSMGFTGRKAMKWKHAFYDAFEYMEKILLQQQNASWQQVRIEGKYRRLELTDSIKRYVEFAESLGSKNSQTYYINITNLIYKLLFDLKKVPAQFRDSLDADALSHLEFVESKMAQWLDNSIKSCTDSHEPYKAVKRKLRSLIAVIGTMNFQQQIEI